MKRKRDDELKTRCSWANEKHILQQYHDKEWGVPVHDDRKHFEMLILEGAQAGLNWITILEKRENYRNLFKQFDPNEIVKMSDADLEKCLKDEGIIRNKLKVYSIRKNAHVFLDIQKEFGSFYKYIWQFVEGNQIDYRTKIVDLPTQTKESQEISKDLKKRGMTFVGPTIIYSYMQAVGLVNNHENNCHRYRVCFFKKKDSSVSKSDDEINGCVAKI